MLNEKIAAARHVAAALGTSERDAEAMISSGAALLIAAIEARRATGMQVDIASPALEQIVAGIADAVSARGRFVETHRLLANVRDALGITPSAAGCVIGSVQPAATVAECERDAA